MVSPRPPRSLLGRALRPLSSRTAALLIATFGLPLGACTRPEHSPPGESKSSEPSPRPNGPTSPAGVGYGAPLTQRPKTSLSEVLDHPEAYDDKTVLVEGHVRRACSRKGCWMEIAADRSEGAEGCRVTFQDYAFFVPTDSAGKHALVEAKVQLSRVKASHVEHLESEGGTFRKKNPDGSADEVQLMASGVVLSGG